MAPKESLDALPGLSGNQAFLIEQNTHILESIKFADQKAAGIGAISTGLLYFILTTVLPELPSGELAARALVGSVCLLLLAGVLLAISVLYPPAHLYDKTTSGGRLALPQFVAKQDQSTFTTRIVGISSQELTEQLAALVHQRCRIRAGKYKLLRIAFYVFGAAFSAATILVVLHVARG